MAVYDHGACAGLFFTRPARYFEGAIGGVPARHLRGIVGECLSHRSAGLRVKLIIAVIQPTKLDPLREALVKIGVTRMTVCDAQGYGQQRGRTAMYRGHEYKTNLLRKIELEILVNDDFVERTIESITSVARTGPEGSIGDGKIFVLPAERVVRISDVLEGPEAV